VQQATVAAASCGHEQVLEFLLDMSEVKADMPDTLQGQTGLCSAAAKGHLKCAEILVRRGAKVSTTDLEGTPPIHHAVTSGNWPLTELLIKEGARLDQTDSQGRTPLMAASTAGHAGLVELLVNKGGKHLLESRDKEGRTPLVWAAQSARTAAAAALLDAGADVHHGDRAGKTPLDHAVCAQGAEDMADVVRLLMDRGSAMEHVDLEGRRPLDRAIEVNNAQAVQAFLRKGAKLGPATWAAAAHKPDIMLILLNKLLEDGNTLYKRSKFEEAAHRYTYALRRIPASVANNNVSSPQASKRLTLVVEDTIGQGQPKAEVGHESLLEQLKTHLLLNLSRCQRRLCDWEGAVESASRVIEARPPGDPSHLTALHARAKAAKESGHLDMAARDLGEALTLSPNNRDLHKLIIKVKEEIRKSDEENSTPKVPIGAAAADVKYLDETVSDAGAPEVVTTERDALFSP